MREPPDIPAEALVAAVQAAYGISVLSLTFLPIGHDSSASVYKVQATDGGAYFLKVRRGAVYQPGLVVPSHLRERGLAHVIAPLRTSLGALWTEIDGYALVLYPYIEGRTGMEVGLTEDQWVAFCSALSQVHATPLAPPLLGLVGMEPYAPRWGGATRSWSAARELAHRITATTFTDPVQRETGEFWNARNDQIRLLVDRAEDLARRLRLAALPPVLCHADVHTGNVLLDGEQRLWIVDWDETVLAPRERDLMFVVGGIMRGLVGPREEACFFQGYGKVAINPLALAYYRYAWAVQDISDFGEQVFARPDLGPETRREAAELLRGLFEPGNIVDLAASSDHTVS